MSKAKRHEIPRQTPEAWIGSAESPATCSGRAEQLPVFLALHGDCAALMDEPFGALDAETRRSMQELLNEVITKTEMTVVLVTHDIIEALFLSDRIVFMSRHPGRVRVIIPLDFKEGRKISTHEQLFALPEYAAYESHIFVLMREVTA